MIPKLNIRLIIAITFFALLAYSCTTTLLMQHWQMKADENATEREQVIKLLKGEREKTNHYINKYHEEVAHTKANYITKANVKRLIDTKEFEHLKHLEGKDFKIKNLESSLSYYVSLNADSILMAPFTAECDSNKLRGWKWQLHDEWNDIEAIVLDTPKFDVRIPLRGAIYLGRRTKKFLFFRYGPRSIETQVFSPNKLVKIDSVDFTVVRQ